MFYLSNARQPSVLRPQTTCPGELLLIDFLSESYSNFSVKETLES